MQESAPAVAGPPALTIDGESASKPLSVEELAALPQAEVSTVDRRSGETLFLRGPTLRSLLTLVEAPTGHGLRGPNMLLVVVAEASDGYKVGFTLSELDDQFGDNGAIVAISQGGDALPEGDGPLRIIVPDDEHRARCVRQVERFRLVRVE